MPCCSSVPKSNFSSFVGTIVGLTPLPVPWRRERRKQRFTELEAALDQLSEQVQGGRAENQALTDQNTALQACASRAFLLDQFQRRW